MKSAPRFLFWLALIAVPVLLNCHHNAPIEAATIRAKPTALIHERITGVTLLDGSLVKFNGGVDPIAASDSVFGSVNGHRRAVPLDSAQRVWVSRFDGVRTTFAVVGIAVLVVGTVGAIALASKQSCPFIYSWDGTRYVFDAEPYGGAITRGLERDDYGELRSLVADRGRYRLLVTNEVNETQFTNQLQLIVVDHPVGELIKADEFGQLYALDSLAAPITALDQDGRDLKPWLSHDDQLIWEPIAPPDQAHGARQEITLTFAKPVGASKGFLVARAATGLWGSQMIRQFSQLRGTALADWYATIDTSAPAAAALRQWNLREELYALQLHVEEPGGWAVRGVVPGGGPFLAADRVIPLDLSHVRGDSVRIRIRPPYGFWALNSFQMAFGARANVRATILPPLAARTSDGRDVQGELTSVDDRYYAMPNTGDYGYVTFAAPPLEATMSRTVFVHARGYYRLHLDPTTAPDTATLARFFQTPDAAALFAAAQFEREHAHAHAHAATSH